MGIKKDIYFIVFTLLISISAFSQVPAPSQTVKGKVVEQLLSTPIEGVEITLLPLGIGSVTDSLGNFSIKEVPVGRYTLVANHLSFSSVTIPELLVKAGKETVINFTMATSTSNLQEIVISGDISLEEAESIGKRQISVEETKRFPATFNDPARLVPSFAGVVNTNDQGNSISVRGNSPNHLQWRLEGLEIVNPNHLSNTGTLNDRPAINGGGVNMLSAQLLDNSYFYIGPLPTKFGNSLAGVFDMHLRNGNKEKKEFTVQAGLIGIDLSAEGPIKKAGESSFLVNYRYSTVGLLSKLGVPLGDEEINFQDLAIHLNFPLKNGAYISIFGMGGNSSNIYEGKKDSTKWEVDKDRKNIAYKAKMGAIGLQYFQPLRHNLSMRNKFILSAREDKRSEEIIYDKDLVYNNGKDYSLDRKIAYASAFTYTPNKRNSLEGGIFINYDYFSLSSSIRPLYPPIIDGQKYFWRIEPYVDWKVAVSDKIKTNVGIHFLNSSLNHSFTTEPRLKVQWKASKKNSFAFSYALQSQSQPASVYFSKGFANNYINNSDLGISKAHHFQISEDSRLSKKLILHTAVYYQHSFDIPISEDKSSSFSLINYQNEYINEQLINEGTGNNYGLDLSLEKYLTEKYYFIFSASAYNATYMGWDNIERESRYNGHYAFNFTGGAEYDISKNRVLSLNIRMVELGGLRYTPIDLSASRALGKTVYKEDEAFSEKLNDYFKVDFNISLRKNKTNFTSIWSLDLQNITNIKNDGYRYYDATANKILTIHQLGIIPVLSYRIEW